MDFLFQILVFKSWFFISGKTHNTFGTYVDYNYGGMLQFFSFIASFFSSTFLHIEVRSLCSIDMKFNYWASMVQKLNNFSRVYTSIVTWLSLYKAWRNIFYCTPSCTTLHTCWWWFMRDISFKHTTHMCRVVELMWHFENGFLLSLMITNTSYNLCLSQISCLKNHLHDLV